MDFNYEYSKLMKERFNHKYNYCYCNAFDLLENKLVDYVVIGYITSEKHNIAFRHGWSIKSNEIIDSTLADDYNETYKYNEAFRVNLSDAIERNYQDDLGLCKNNNTKEIELIARLERDGYIIMSSFDSIQDLRIFRKLLKTKLKKLKSNTNM